MSSTTKAKVSAESAEAKLERLLSILDETEYACQDAIERLAEMEEAWYERLKKRAAVYGYEIVHDGDDSPYVLVDGPDGEILEGYGDLATIEDFLNRKEDLRESLKDAVEAVKVEKAQAMKEALKAWKARWGLTDEPPADEVDPKALGVSADGGDDDAKRELMKLAKDAGLSEDVVNDAESWADVATAILAA